VDERYFKRVFPGILDMGEKKRGTKGGNQDSCEGEGKKQGGGGKSRTPNKKQNASVLILIGEKN